LARRCRGLPRPVGESGLMQRDMFGAGFGCAGNVVGVSADDLEILVLAQPGPSAVEAMSACPEARHSKTVPADPP
jgi:hypothetical protein